MAWTTYDEAIDVIERRYQFFPRVFRWRGHRYDVETVECSWTTGRPGPRRYFRVQSGAAVFEVYQDLLAGSWHVRRAQWGQEPARAPWASVLGGRYRLKREQAES